MTSVNHENATFDHNTDESLLYSPTGPAFTATGSSIIPEYSSVPINIAQIFFSTLGLFFNAVIFMTYAFSRKLRTPQNVFIMNLAVADFMLLAVSFTQTSAVITGTAYSSFLCDFFAFTIVVDAYASMMFMGAIGLTRLVSICFPQRKSQLFVWWRCVLLAVLIWVYNVGILAALGHFIYLEKMHLCGYDVSYSLVSNIVLNFGTYSMVCCVMLVCYLHIYRAFRRSQRQIAQHGAHKEGGGIKKEEIRLALQLLVIFIIYNVCWGPLILLSNIIDPYGKIDIRVYEFVLFLMYINSVVNGPVYLYFNKLFRKEVWRIWLRYQPPATAMSSSQ